MELVSIIDKLLAPVRRRVRLMISRAILAGINDGTGIQLVQVKLLDGEVRDGVERMQNYGFTSVPLGGAEGVMACVSGDRDHGIVIAVDDRRYRIKGRQPGEVALYSDEGDSIILKRGRVMEVTTETFRVNAGTTIELNAPTITGNASAGIALNTPIVAASTDIVAQGEIADHGNKSMSAMRGIYNDHGHIDPQGGSVGPANGQM